MQKAEYVREELSIIILQNGGTGLQMEFPTTPNNSPTTRNMQRLLPINLFRPICVSAG